ncbi:MAG: TIGR03435 family protein [Acidobacteriota bacterium]
MRSVSQAVLIALTIVVAGMARAQAPATPRFEVASIKPATFPSDEYKAGFLAGGGNCPNVPLTISDNRVSMQMVRLCSLIRVAYQLQDYRIAFANGVKAIVKDDELFDIQATATGEVTQDRAREMLKALLAERFQLKFHMEPREVPIYALTVAKGGPKLLTVDDGNCAPAELIKRIEKSSLPRGARTTSSCKANQSLDRIATLLTREAGRPVIDRTGLTGQYSYTLSWTPDGVSMEANSPPLLSTAIQEQLGLKFEAIKAPFDVLVVDSAAQPGAN